MQQFDQARLALDQAILVTGQQFEFCNHRRIRFEWTQVFQITAASLGQHIGINCIGLDSSCIAPAIDSFGIDRVDGERSLKPGRNQQSLRRLYNTGELLRRPGKVEQKAFQLIAARPSNNRYRPGKLPREARSLQDGRAVMW